MGDSEKETQTNNMNTDLEKDINRLWIVVLSFIMFILSCMLAFAIVCMVTQPKDASQITKNTGHYTIQYPNASLYIDSTFFCELRCWIQNAIYNLSFEIYYIEPFIVISNNSSTQTNLSFINGLYNLNITFGGNSTNVGMTIYIHSDETIEYPQDMKINGSYNYLEQPIWFIAVTGISIGFIISAIGAVCSFCAYRVFCKRIHKSYRMMG